MPFLGLFSRLFLSGLFRFLVEVDRRGLPEPLVASAAAEEAEGAEGALRKAFAQVLGRDVTEAL